MLSTSGISTEWEGERQSGSGGDELQRGLTPDEARDRETPKEEEIGCVVICCLEILLLLVLCRRQGSDG